MLDSTTFANRTGWSLDFQLAVGVDGFGQPNGLGSAVQIGNVTLTEVFATPTPAPLALMLLALPALASLARTPRPSRTHR